MNMPSKLAIGTAQFGLDYGISNTRGKIPEEEVFKILDKAYHSNVRYLDTAPAYGNAEELIGHFLRQNSSASFKITTKIPRLDTSSVPKVKDTFKRSLERLSVTKVHGLLLHDASDLLGNNGGSLWRILEDLKNEGLCEKIGVSTYEPFQIESVLKSFPITLIQAPLNILDQRLIKAGILPRLKRAGVEFHARSVFLQGLLLMESSDLPVKLQAAGPHIKKLEKIVSGGKTTRLKTCYGFVNTISEVDAVVCGVTSLEQLGELISVSKASPSNYNFTEFGIEDPMILNPVLWGST